MVFQLHAAHSLVYSHQTPCLPCSPVSRQDLVSWKMALDKRQLPEVDRNVRNEKYLIVHNPLLKSVLYAYVNTLSLSLSQCLLKASGYIDIDRINAAAWPALVADLGAGDQSITALAFGKLFI